MESKIVSALRLKFNPVATIWTDEKPEEAIQFKQGRWACVMFLFAGTARGKTAVFDRETFGCFGGGVGLGFGNQYLTIPGGIECFYYFLSTGNEQWERGKEIGEQIKPFVTEETFDEFIQGERYVRSPELVKRFVEVLPIVDIPAKYVVFKPLRDVDLNNEEPVVITFLADPDQISALGILANYATESFNNVIMPFAAGCQTIGIFPYREAKSESPRAVVGLTDLSARKNIRKQLGKDLLSFSVPLKLFQDMEENVEGSFLERPTWGSLKKTAP